MILLVLRTVWTATYYDLIQMITGGGPAGATTHLPIMIYQNSFGNPQHRLRFRRRGIPRRADVRVCGDLREEVRRCRRLTQKGEKP